MQNISKFQNIYIVAVIFLILIIIAGLIIARFSIETLEEYIINLKELSTDTLHELNLPIATIKINADMIRKSLNDNKSLARLKRIDMATTMLTQRYCEIDYMIKQQMKYEIIDNFDLKELILQRIEFLQALYPYMKFTTDLENFWIKIDKIGLSKVIDNIIDNGVKYSNQKYQMELSLKDSSLSIKDNGIGMDEVTLFKIFDKYYQNDNSMLGFGIGLSMIKRFCDTNHIKLNIISKKDIGTTVLLDFKGR